MPKPGPSPSRTMASASSNRRLGGKAKLQWKVDWAARWVALGVDYEMAGKDLIDSVTQSSKIARALGGRPPEGFNYEMFLDEQGEKISKSKGNGLSLDEWLRYGSEESLAFFIYREPRKAKSLHIGVIPRAVDEYWQFREKYAEQPIEQKLGNPVHHIHGGNVPATALPLTYGLLLNLVSLPGVGDKDTAWKFVQRYAPGTSADSDPELDQLIGLAVNYATRFRHSEPQAAGANRAGSRGATRPRFGIGGPARGRRCRSHPAPRLRGRQAPPVRIAAPLVPGALRDPARLRPRGRAWAASSRSTG